MLITTANAVPGRPEQSAGGTLLSASATGADAPDALFRKALTKLVDQALDNPQRCNAIVGLQHSTAAAAIPSKASGYDFHYAVTVIGRAVWLA